MFDFVSFIPRAIVQGIPLLFGSTGETLTEKSGNLNLGIPGIMYVGGICGVIGAFLYENSVPASGALNPFLAVCIPLLSSLLGSLLMGLLYSGQIHTFTPSTYLDKSDLTVIRPLVYFREQEITDAIQHHGFQPVKSPCPIDGHTIRQKVKDLIKELSIDNPQLYPHLASAMRENAVGELWPPAKNRKEMQKAYYEYMYGPQDK